MGCSHGLPYQPLAVDRRPIFRGRHQPSRGSYLLTISGPGTATIGGAVPEPATWAMMILGIGAVGFAMRSAKRRSDGKFDAKIKRITAGATA